MFLTVLDENQTCPELFHSKNQKAFIYRYQRVIELHSLSIFYFHFYFLLLGINIGLYSIIILFYL